MCRALYSIKCCEVRTRAEPITRWMDVVLRPGTLIALGAAGAVVGDDWVAAGAV
jgi:hypothetical protein